MVVFDRWGEDPAAALAAAVADAADLEDGLASGCPRARSALARRLPDPRSDRGVLPVPPAPDRRRARPGGRDRLAASCQRDPCGPGGRPRDARPVSRTDPGAVWKRPPAGAARRRRRAFGDRRPDRAVHRADRGTRRHRGRAGTGRHRRGREREGSGTVLAATAWRTGTAPRPVSRPRTSRSSCSVFGTSNARAVPTCFASRHSGGSVARDGSSPTTSSEHWAG